MPDSRLARTRSSYKHDIDRGLDNIIKLVNEEIDRAEEADKDTITFSTWNVRDIATYLDYLKARENAE